MKLNIPALFLLGVLSTGVFAQPIPSPDARPPLRPQDLQIMQLQSRLNAINQAQQSLYQQFQMLQEMRRNEIMGTSPQVLPGSGLNNQPPINYDDMVRQQREHQDRLKRYEHDLDDVYARYSELDAQKKAVLEELVELGKPQQ